MTAVDVLREARAAGVSVEAEGDRLRVSGRGHPPDDLLSWLREHRDAVLEILRREAAVMPDTAESAGETGPPKPQSARVYVPSVDSEVWIASDQAEATRLGEELGAEGDERPVILAEDVAKLATLPMEGLVAAVRALVAFPGARVASAKPLPDLPEGAKGAVYFTRSDGSLTLERVIGAPDDPSAEAPTEAPVESVRWSRKSAAFVTWFERALADGRLPAEPFQLDAGRRVADPKRWYRSLEQDIARGPRRPRAGVLIEELRRLREIVETNDSPA